MTFPLIREFKLAGPEGDGIHPYLNGDGAFIGRGTPLLEKDGAGRWRPRSRFDLERILQAGYGIPLELEGRIAELGTVARSLNKGDRALACIALLHARLPALPDMEASWRMAKADGFGKFDPDQPRVPAGDHGGGQWSSGGGGAAPASTKEPESSPGAGASAADATPKAIVAASTAAIGADAVRLPSLMESISPAALGILKEGILRSAGPLAAFGVVMFKPTPAGVGSSGSLPDHPDIHYQLDDRLLSLRQVDADGTTHLLYYGMRGDDGMFRTSDGAAVGRMIGDSLMLESGTAILSSTQATAIRAGSYENLDAPPIVANDNYPKLCPLPGPDIPHGASPRATAYQEQVTGLPPGLAVWLNGVAFDGCRTSDGVMLEAKGLGFEWAMTPYGWRPGYEGGPEMEEEMFAQSIAAKARLVEWHVADPRVADYLRDYAKKFPNILVLYDPPRKP